jgi:hypothetical protein
MTRTLIAGQLSGHHPPSEPSVTYLRLTQSPMYTHRLHPLYANPKNPALAQMPIAQSRTSHFEHRHANLSPTTTEERDHEKEVPSR